MITMIGLTLSNRVTGGNVMDRIIALDHFSEKVDCA